MLPFTRPKSIQGIQEYALQGRVHPYLPLVSGSTTCCTHLPNRTIIDASKQNAKKGEGVALTHTGNNAAHNDDVNADNDEHNEDDHDEDDQDDDDDGQQPANNRLVSHRQRQTERLP